MKPGSGHRLGAELSRVQGKSISKQLPLYESIVTAHEQISGHTYADDNKVASILQAVPAHLRSHLQLWSANTTTYEQLKEKATELEALATKWDSSNSLSLPTRMSMDEATPMEVDNVRDKWKKGGNSKSKDSKGQAKGKEKGKSKTDGGRGSWKTSEKGKSQWEKGGQGKKGKLQRKGKLSNRMSPATTAARWDTMLVTARSGSRSLRKQVVVAALRHHQLDAQDQHLQHRLRHQ